MISVEQEGWNPDMDRVLLNLTVEAHTRKGEFKGLNFRSKPLQCIDGWQG